MAGKATWYDQVLVNYYARVLTVTLIEIKEWREGRLLRYACPKEMYDGQVLVYLAPSEGAPVLTSWGFPPDRPMPQDDDDIDALEWEELDTGEHAAVVNGVPVLPKK